MIPFTLTWRSSSEYQKGLFCGAVFSVGDPSESDVNEEDILMLEDTDNKEL